MLLSLLKITACHLSGQSQNEAVVLKEKEGIPKVPKPSNIDSKEVPICNNVSFQTVNCESPLTGPRMSRMIARAAMYDKHISNVSTDTGTMRYGTQCSGRNMCRAAVHSYQGMSCQNMVILLLSSGHQYYLIFFVHFAVAVFNFHCSIVRKSTLIKLQNEMIIFDKGQHYSRGH